MHFTKIRSDTKNIVGDENNTYIHEHRKFHAFRQK